jgi:hypothetical protein
MAKVNDSSLSGGRQVQQLGSATDGQEAPRTDNRYRVNDSVRFYVVQLCGTWVNVTETAQRVLKRKNRQSYVTFEGAEYQLRPATQFRDVLRTYTKHGADVHLLGMEVTNKNLDEVDPWPFIWIEPKVAKQVFQAYHIDKDMERFSALRRETKW